MDAQIGRYSYHPQGLWQAILLIILYPQSWRERWRASITDHLSGKTYCLNEDEEALLDDLHELIRSMRENAGVSPFKAHHFLTKPRLMAVRNRVFHAIVLKRNGHPKQWDRLTHREPRELEVWVDEVFKTAPRQHEI